MAAIKQDLYELVTNKVVAALEGGALPWASPWRGAGCSMHPANLATGRAYRGVNVLLLNMQAAVSGFATNQWLTFHQAKSLGGHVRRGEQGSPVVFFKMLDKSEPGTADERTRTVYPLLRRFTVFNAQQVDGLPPEYAVARPTCSGTLVLLQTHSSRRRALASSTAGIRRSTPLRLT